MPFQLVPNPTFLQLTTSGKISAHLCPARRHVSLWCLRCPTTSPKANSFTFCCNQGFQNAVLITLRTHNCVCNCVETSQLTFLSSPSRASSKTVVLLPGSRWRGVINFCATPSLPSAGPLPPVFIAGSRPGHSCYFLFFWCCHGSVCGLYCRLIGTHERECGVASQPTKHSPPLHQTASA